MIVNINIDNYDEYINNNDLVILEFGAMWCSPCKILENILKEIEQENNNITIGKVDIESSPDIAMKFGIMSVPSMVIIKNTQVIEKINGLKDKEFIEKLINRI